MGIKKTTKKYLNVSIIGAGYMAEYAVSKAFIDGRVSRIYAGSNEIMKELIARYL